jgi:hypothetical protein
VRVFHLGAFAEERVGFVKEENGVAALGRSENSIEVLFSFANLFTHDA